MDRNEFHLSKNSNLKIDISTAAYKVLDILLSHSDTKGKCFPSMTLMENEYHIPKSTSIRAIKELKDKSIIAVSKRKIGKGNNEYQISKEYLINKNCFKEKKEILDLFDYDWLNDSERD